MTCKSGAGPDELWPGTCPARPGVGYATGERASKTHEQTHGQEQNRMRMARMRESRDSDRFLVNTQVQSHALLCRGFGTSVPFIAMVTIYSQVISLVFHLLAIVALECYLEHNSSSMFSLQGEPLRSTLCISQMVLRCSNSCFSLAGKDQRLDFD